MLSKYKPHKPFIMRTCNNHPQWYNQPLRLTEEQRKNPMLVLYEFFECYHLNDVRDLFWKWLVEVLSSPGSISAEALEIAQQRLGHRAGSVIWLEADITQTTLSHHKYDVWHDRAVFHFLTEAQDRQRYVNAVTEAVRPGGHVIVATFANDGPERCSGLEVARYDPQSLHSEFGTDFELLDSIREEHKTPFGTEQKFMYCYCRKY